MNQPETATFSSADNMGTFTREKTLRVLKSHGHIGQDIVDFFSEVGERCNSEGRGLSCYSVRDLMLWLGY
jgi:hypothetical protein